MPVISALWRSLRLRPADDVCGGDCGAHVKELGGGEQGGEDRGRGKLHEDDGAYFAKYEQQSDCLCRNEGQLD